MYSIFGKTKNASSDLVYKSLVEVRYQVYNMSRDLKLTV